MTKSKDNSPNRTAIADAVEEIPFGKLVWNFLFREGKAIKQGWLALIIIASLCFWGGSSWRASTDEKETKTAEETHKLEIKKSDDRIKVLEHDLKIAKEERDKAQIELAPWMLLANQLQRNAPPDKRLDLLLEQVRSLQKLMQDTSANPHNDPIASASATVTVEFLTDNPKKPGFNIGHGGLVTLAGKNGCILMAHTTNNYAVEADPGHGKLRIVADASVDDSYMGKPVKSLLEAGLIQIVFRRELVPAGTQILSGQIVWVINNRITLKFKVPALSAIQMKDQADLTILTIVDISDGLSSLNSN